jgi:hypothetical protein
MLGTQRIAAQSRPGGIGGYKDRGAYQQVNIAVWRVIAAGYRTEQAHPVRVMMCGDSHDLLSPGCYQTTQW